MKESSVTIFNLKNSNNISFTLSKNCTDTFLNDALDLIVPGMARKTFNSIQELDEVLTTHLEDLKRILIVLNLQERSEWLVNLYQDEIVKLNHQIQKDAKAMHEGDPAAKSLAEVLICYPGLYAIAVYRLAHFFYEHDIALLPRILSEIAHEKTGIDIHPGAKIGESFFIDHGTGIVIGESAIIGRHVKIYQGVTLGALSVDKSQAQRKRHPTIEDHCVIYSHATILGGETIIGAHSVIGGNVWLTKSIAEHSIVYHKSEIKLDKNKNSEQVNFQEELTYEI